MTLERLEERAEQLVLHSRLNYAYRRMQEYLQSSQDLGGDPRGGAQGPAGGLLLGRVRAARVAADLLGRPRRARRRPRQERLRPRRPAGRRRAVLRAGLLPAAARRDGLAARGLPRRRRPAVAAGAADRRRTTARSRWRSRPAGATISARVWKATVGRNTLLLLDSDVEANTPEDRQLTARLYGGDQRVRIRQELLLGVGGHAGPEGAGHPPGRPPPERGAQRLRRAGDDPRPDEDRGDRLRGGDAAGRRRRRSSPPTRRCPPATTGSPPS